MQKVFFFWVCRHSLSPLVFTTEVQSVCPVSSAQSLWFNPLWVETSVFTGVGRDGDPAAQGRQDGGVKSHVQIFQPILFSAPFPSILPTSRTLAPSDFRSSLGFWGTSKSALGLLCCWLEFQLPVVFLSFYLFICLQASKNLSPFSCLSLSSSFMVHAIFSPLQSF